eukprot:jgi/Bigna1/91259/estExt_fgenesh1_pg.C_940045
MGFMNGDPFADNNEEVPNGKDLFQILQERNLDGNTARDNTTDSRNSEKVTAHEHFENLFDKLKGFQGRRTTFDDVVKSSDTQRKRSSKSRSGKKIKKFGFGGKTRSSSASSAGRKSSVRRATKPSGGRREIDEDDILQGLSGLSERLSLPGSEINMRRKPNFRSLNPRLKATAAQSQDSVVTTENPLGEDIPLKDNADYNDPLGDLFAAGRNEDETQDKTKTLSGLSESVIPEGPMKNQETLAKGSPTIENVAENPNKELKQTVEEVKDPKKIVNGTEIGAEKQAKKNPNKDVDAKREKEFDSPPEEVVTVKTSNVVVSEENKNTSITGASSVSSSTQRKEPAAARIEKDDGELKKQRESSEDDSMLSLPSGLISSDRAFELKKASSGAAMSTGKGVEEEDNSVINNEEDLPSPFSKVEDMNGGSNEGGDATPLSLEKISSSKSPMMANEVTGRTEYGNIFGRENADASGSTSGGAPPLDPASREAVKSNAKQDVPFGMTTPNMHSSTVPAEISIPTSVSALVWLSIGVTMTFICCAASLVLCASMSSKTNKPSGMGGVSSSWGSMHGTSAGAGRKSSGDLELGVTSFGNSSFCGGGGGGDPSPSKPRKRRYVKQELQPAITLLDTATSPRSQQQTPHSSTVELGENSSSSSSNSNLKQNAFMQVKAHQSSSSLTTTTTTLSKQGVRENSSTIPKISSAEEEKKTKERVPRPEPGEIKRSLGSSSQSRSNGGTRARASTAPASADNAKASRNRAIRFEKLWGAKDLQSKKITVAVGAIKVAVLCKSLTRAGFAIVASGQVDGLCKVYCIMESPQNKKCVLHEILGQKDGNLKILGKSMDNGELISSLSHIRGVILGHVSR